MYFDIEKLTKSFGMRTALDKVSIKAQHPEMIGVIGRSGAGKSTLLRCINRLTDADSGRIIVDGTDVTCLAGRDRRLWRARCAMIFQQFNLVPRLDVVTNILCGTLSRRPVWAGLFNFFSRDDIDRAVELLHHLSLEDHGLDRAGNLSGGQQQRVAIARALMQNPDIILADEPIASLDPRNAEQIMQILHDINRQENKLVLVNLHSVDMARRFCDRIIGLRQGQVVFDGPVDALDDRAVAAIYDGARADAAMAASVTANLEERHDPLSA